MASDLARRVAITGMGAVGSFGIGCGALWDALGAGRRTFAPCTRYRGSLPCAEAVRPDLRRMLKTGQTSRMSLVSQFAIAAVHLALDQGRLATGKGAAGRVIGIVYGTSHGPAATTQEIYDDLIDRGAAAVKPRAFQESVFNAPASLASIQFGLKGPIQVLAASASAPVVLQQAQILLAHPGVDAVIALCADELCEAVQSALRALRWHRPAPETDEPSSPRPRRGAISSEGAAALLLERADDAAARCAPALAEMAGAVSTNDAWQLVRPAPDARGLVAAVHGCLADAEATPAEVDIILRAVSHNDVDDRLQAEAARSVFGGAVPPVASTTDDIGHAMGAAGMFDVALAVEMMHRGRGPRFPGRDRCARGANRIRPVHQRRPERHVRSRADPEFDMVRTALVFPGQGTQFAGMGRGLVDAPMVSETIEKCARDTDLPVRNFVLSTPDSALRETERAQPAIFALSLGVARAVLDAGVRPSLFAGHSVGHFSALAASGAVRHGDAARLVAERGQLMAASGARRPGGMGVVHGLDLRTVTETLDASGLPLWPAVVNLPRQITVSGERGAIEEGRCLLSALGGKWRELNVSGAFHSPLLDAEAEAFAIRVDTVDIAAPSAPVLRNRDGVALTRTKCIRDDLKRHMTQPVRWVAIMDALRDSGTSLVIEAGPGRVLSGLIRRHVPGLAVMTTESPSALRRAIDVAAGSRSRGSAR